MSSELCDESRYSGTAPLLELFGSGFCGKQNLNQVTISKSVDEVLSFQDGCKNLSVLPRERFQSGDASALFDFGPAQVIECFDGFAFGFCMGECVHVSLVAFVADLGIPPKIGNTFSHGLPPPRSAFIGLDDSKNSEFARIVYCGLDTKNIERVIHLEGVFAQAVFDAPAFLAFLEIGCHLCLQISVQLPA